MPYRNREDEKAHSERYYREHKEHILAYKKHYYLEHKEEKDTYCREYDKRNHEAKKRRLRELNQAVRLEVLTHYGNGRCACIRCGESRLACLSIDHIQHVGAQRKVRRGESTVRWLKKNNYPIGYQTLCMNCQWVKRTENREWEKVDESIKEG